jgi:hypothetical protein
VEDGEGRLDGLLGEVEVEVGQGVGRGQALVDDGAEAAGRHVRAGGGGGDAASQPVGGPLPLAAVAGLATVAGEDRLDDGGPAGPGLVTEDGVVGGRRAPLDQLQALVDHGLLG